MFRLVGFFVTVFVTYRLLSFVPVVGPLLWRLGFIGYWIVAILVSTLAARFGSKLLERARLKQQMLSLSSVKTPNTEGKLGTLLLKAGHLREAIPHLQVAFEGQPEVLDWAFGLGRANLALGQYEDAGRYFARVVRDAPQYGSGFIYVGLAQAAFSLGRPLDALDAIDAHDRYHGVKPEALFLRGQALVLAGQKKEARKAFQAVLEMGSDLPRYQRKGYLSLAFRAWLAKWR